MAFGKCTNGVALSKVRQNLESVQLTVQEKQYFTPVLTCSNLSKTHPRDYLRSSRNGSFSLNFPLAKAVILRAILLRLHLFAHLIESYPTVHGLSSCVEKKISILLVAHTTVTMYVHRTMSFFWTFECSYSSVLRRILLKLHILTRLIESFPTFLRFMELY